ncbi:hypothetical protein NEOLEDRAFT_1073434 [Neolentinus lepideus HHB14362 ss-1]|uniref:Ricin B lectin domain-containing protein n=1 Tax=Neolentinus lepideus HHB14362 ss-1 TaxID=1314782 RepID=A0A165PQG9_9AGAM|nr:hypothetical protein NEOLEDRAFT_1073434 [Neolentinus lepideus HHB14362 ss-1]
MTISTGRYTLTNVRFHNLAFLPDPNDGSPVIANFSQNSPGEKWNVTELGNGNYTFQNVGNASYASAGHRSKVGNYVEGRSQPQQFSVQETRVKGQYTIATTDSRIFWGLSDSETDTPISLAESATDARNWWIFQKTT